MRKAQLTMQDIADRLGISKSTVSRALKDHPDISDETKQAVVKLAKELDFQPNTLALSLRQKKTNNIGVIIPEIVHDFFAKIITGVQEVAYNSGYNVIMCQTNESYEREKTDINALFSSRVDGMLISVAKETEDFSHITNIYNKGMPIVFFDRSCDLIHTSKVVTDDFDGAFQATEHLINQGCKHIAHLLGPKNLDISISRLEGYKAALTKYGIEINENLIVKCGEGTQEEAARVTDLILEEGDTKIDGIFANNDMAALGAMQSIKKHNLKIPDDIAVVGFSNWQLAEIVDPPLSSVSQSAYEIGIAATKLLLKEIESNENEEIKPETKVLKPQLVIRASSQKKK
ncbi:LacI family transcriptional regulator [Sediminitomix flava]|uniref:LacI family transcriptional regulator n=2 Tax=Sediminitomix flava TaxID=379075 RepID=A0A315Z7I9_SEDFL|nr:LacI family transcriptional regulator [Sediminitomix flava]